MTITAQVPDELKIEIPGLELAALAWGPPDGKPVLALHGWLDNAASFCRLAPLLPGCRVVALDLPGHGRSGHRHRAARYHFIDYPADVLASMDSLGLGRCALLGHSLGGAVASVVAGACPDRVERLALIEALGPIAAEAGEAPGRLAEYCRRAGSLNPSRLPQYDGLEDAVAARVRATGMSTDAARPIVERGVKANGDGSVTWRSDPRLTLPSPQRLAEAQVLEYLAAIEAETLLIAARHRNEYVRDEIMAERIRRVKRLQVIVLGGSHHLHLDDAGTVAGVLGPFLAGDAL